MIHWKKSRKNRYKSVQEKCEVLSKRVKSKNREVSPCPSTADDRKEGF